MPTTIREVDQVTAEREDLVLSPDELHCALNGEAIGLHEVGRDDPEYYTFTSYYELVADGDEAATVLCEDCVGWLAEVGPAIAEFWAGPWTR